MLLFYTKARHPPPLALLPDVLSPDSLQGPHATRSLDVADNADGDHWRSLDDGDCLDNLLLVVLGARAVHLVSSHIIKHEQHKQTHMNTNYEHNINII